MNLTAIRRFFRRLAARLRLSDRLVCEESAEMGLADFHDYRDTIDGKPWHMISVNCKRCGKKFVV